MPSPAGWAEVPCAKCGTKTPGIDFGEYCPTCGAERDRRAKRLSQLVAVAATLSVLVYVVFFVPRYPLAQAYGWIAVIATLMIVRRVSFRVAREFLR